MSEEPNESLFIRGENAPTLSLAMIVKDEIDTIERCLRTARPHVDEIVVVDTGSTDGTRDVARQYADVFDEIEWPDSFSKARNHSFDLAGCDYVMYLDGDEHIPNPIHWELIRKGIAHPDVGLLKLRLHNVLPEDSLISASEIWHERVFLNVDEMRWEGKVHNQIIRAAQSVLKERELGTMDVDAEIIHTGYALEADATREKYRERLPLLIDEFENPRSAVTRAYYGFQLGLVYVVLGEWENAFDVLRGLDFELLNGINGFYAQYLATRAATIQEEYEVAMNHCEGMLRLDRTEPVAFFTLAYLLFAVGRGFDGILALIEAYEVNEEHGREARFQLDSEKLVDQLESVFREGEIGTKARRVLRAYVSEQAGDHSMLERLVEVLDERPRDEMEAA